MFRSSQIKVCFRLDDPHARSDRSLEAAIFELFARYGVPLCVAVIPFLRPQTNPGTLAGAGRDTMPHLAEGLQAGRIELVQHGYAHAPLSVAPGDERSEFAGVAEAEQRRLVVDGRLQLEEGFATRVRGFVPPWNSYDGTTARILERAGFRFVSAGIEWSKAAANARRARGLAAIPATCNLKTLEHAVAEARRFQRASPAVVCVFHPYEFEEYRDPPAPGDPPVFTNLRTLEARLSWLRTISQVAPCSIADLVDAAGPGHGFMHVSDTWWFHHVPARYRYRFPQSILLRSGLAFTRGVIGWG